ncbi:MAG TPA: hypothetical protein VGO58_07045 [Chitinophagaceae bacterium]|jgi:hypothetical protein|nr:hypothetical protein [Chitinophagaceae bacterium]
MTQPEKNLTEKESLDLIAKMISQAKNSYHDTGRSAMLWGTVVAVCSLVKFTEIQLDYNLPFDIYWLTILAIIPQIFISRKESKDRKVTTYDDIYMDYVWLGFGICIGLMILIVNTMGYHWQPVAEEYSKLSGKESPFQLYEFVGPLFLVLYGMPTFITGAACKFRPMLWGGIICWVCCVITVFTPVKTDLLLIAFSAVFAWLIPGIIMERDYRSAKKGLAQANV